MKARGGTPVEVHRGESAGCAWEMDQRAPRGLLAAGAQDILGYVERTSEPLARNEGPIGRMVAIFDLADEIEIAPSARARTEAGMYRRGFVAVIGDYAAQVRYS